MSNHQYLYEQAQKRAVQTFQHYMRKLWDETDLRFDGDQLSEWRGIIDDVIEASAHRAAMLVAEEQERHIQAVLEKLRPLTCQSCGSQMARAGETGWYCSVCDMWCDEDGAPR